MPDKRKDGGRYVEITDVVKRVDMVEKKVILDSTEGYGRVNKTIEIERIITISGEIIGTLDIEVNRSVP